MNKLSDFINSGILEMYVLGELSAEEKLHVETMAASYPEISGHIHEIGEALETYAVVHAIDPHPTSKAFVMATIDYSERMAAGEKPVFPPTLDEHSNLAEFAEYIQHADMQLRPDFTGIGARIIGYTPSLTTAIVWLKDTEISEIHKHEVEKFLIIEGTCTIVIDNDFREMAAGDFITIPVNKKHFVKITSQTPCKAILQRIAI